MVQKGRSIVHADHKPHFFPTCLGDEWQQRWGSGDAPSGWVMGAHTHNGPPTPLPCKGAPPAAKLRTAQMKIWRARGRRGDGKLVSQQC